MNKLLPFCALFATLSFAYAVPSISTSTKTNAACTLSAIFQSGCTANLCFALDGSGSVSAGEFENATFFAQDVTSTLAFFPDTEYSAVKFGLRSILISFLTGSQQFNERMEVATRVTGRNARRTSVGAGIVSCNSLLAERVGEPNKMIVITDGRNNFGGDPVARANVFRANDPNGRISTVGIGPISSADLDTLNAIAGDSGSVLTVADYIELGQRVNDLICQVCEIY